MNKTWKVHPVAMSFPRLSTDQLRELREDIQTNGIRVPILVNKKQDTIMDGRNRIMIASDLKLKDGQVPLEVFKGKAEEEEAEILSRNLYRRHLTDDQRTAIIAKILGPQLAKEAAERRVRKPVLLKSTQQKEAWEPIADQAKVGQHKARAALDAAKHAPEELDEVIAGKKKLREAAKVANAKKPKVKRPKVEKPLRERVEAAFLKLMEKFAVVEYREVRKILREMLTNAKD
jgi:hypothetical protein